MRMVRLLPFSFWMKPLLSRRSRTVWTVEVERIPLSLEEETPELRLQRLFGPPEDPAPSEED